MPQGKKRLVVVIHEKSIRSNSAFILKVKTIALQLETHPDMFSSPTVPVDTFKMHIDELEEAQTLASTRAGGKVALRDVKYNIVKKDAYSLMAYIQVLADKAATEDEAREIIEMSGYSVKSRTAREKSLISVKNTAVSGVVKIEAKSAGKGCSYEWQISDNRNDWTPLPATRKAKTFVKNLVPGETKYFHYRPVLVGDIPQSWSQVVSIVVT